MSDAIDYWAAGSANARPRELSGGQGLSEHSAIRRDRELIEGDMEITISGLPLHVKAGEFVVMPTNQPHALKANAKSKMLLIIRSQN